MSEFVIEKGVPVPQRKAPPPKYPFARLEIGDSFEAPPIHAKGAQSAASRYKKANPGWDFVARKTQDGARIWRLV